MPGYSDSGPCYSDGVFFVLPAREGGGRGRLQRDGPGGEQICGFLFGRCFFLFFLRGVFRVFLGGEGGPRGSDLGLAVFSWIGGGVFLILAAREGGGVSRRGRGAGRCAWLFTLIVGPVILMVFFLLGRCLFLVSWPGGGVLPFWEEGQEGGHGASREHRPE